MTNRAQPFKSRSSHPRPSSNIDGTARTAGSDEEGGSNGIEPTADDDRIRPIDKRRNAITLVSIILIIVGVACAAALAASPRDDSSVASVATADADDGIESPTSAPTPAPSPPSQANNDEDASIFLVLANVTQASDLAPSADALSSAAASSDEASDSIFSTDKPLTSQPSAYPSIEPTTSGPTTAPSFSPSIKVSGAPSVRPSGHPSTTPTTFEPTGGPTTGAPTTLEPTKEPTSSPTHKPTLSPSTKPSKEPSNNPTNKPTTAQPSTNKPSTPSPSREPTERPSTLRPTPSPSNRPTNRPSRQPTVGPTRRPSREPTNKPSTQRPTPSPSKKPTLEPTPYPSKKPTLEPTNDPTTLQPTLPPTVYDAVVVGAGWSGVRAAQVLSDAGLSVLVLEANDYVGGRAKTIDVDAVPGVPTDLGCEWLYDGTGMESFLSKRGLTGDGDLGTMFERRDKIYVQEVGKDGELSATLLEDEDRLKSDIWGRFLTFKKELLNALGDVSYADAIDRFMKDNKLSTVEEQYLNMFLEGGETEYAGDSNMLSLQDVSLDLDDLGGVKTHYMAVPGAGFGDAAASVASESEAEVRLNSKVVGVDYDDGDVIISYEDDGAAEEVVARSALVTVSLGVLKSDAIAFSPKLPDRKRDAIDNMGFGVLNKIVLYWKDDDAVVWPRDTYWFELITPEDDTSGLWTTWYNPTALKGVPSMVGWISGDEALAMEDRTDEEVLEHATRNLRSMFPEMKEPDEAVITRWARDENARGSYSFEKFDRSFADDASNLKEREGNVWFAGEATNTDGWYATTVGAWDTGEEAAREMISFLKR